MIPVCTAAEIRAADRRQIDDLGVPSEVLMDHAARAVAAAVQAAVPAGRVCIACGPGNNGGDGYAAARWLQAWGRPVCVWPVVPPRTPDAARFAGIAARAGIVAVDGLPTDAAVIVDAVLGTGITRAPDGAIGAAIAAMHAAGRPVIAVDVPSGVDADGGAAPGVAVRATRTVTFGAPKRGLYTGEGAACAGEVAVADIGLGPIAAAASLVEPADLAAVWPRRARGDHKGRSGRLLIVAGSLEMAGAAVLCARGALAAGAGLVTLAAPASALVRLGGLPPEVMVQVRAPEDAFPAGLGPEAFDAVVAGPGLGGGRPLPVPVQETLGRAWASSPSALLFDADALVATAPGAAGPRVLTPHPGEAARLLGAPVVDRFAAARALAARGVTLLKGWNTLVDDGAHTWVCPAGSPALATGGSGDVLAGVIGALLARGLDPATAAWAGATAHGLAGERCAVGVPASAVASALAEVVASL